MQKLIKPSEIKGKIKAPASKSMMQRAIAAGLLAKGKTIIKNPTFCNDSIAAMRVAESLGAIISRFDSEVIIEGGALVKNNFLNCGESGLCMRMFTPIAATFHQSLNLMAEGSLLKRPLSMFDQPMKELNVDFTTTNGFPPVMVKGPIKGGKVTIDGSISSQMLTGFLMALPLAENDSELIVNQLTSRPYIDMTLQVLNDFGIIIENNNYETFSIKGKQIYQPREYFIEGDWSGAAFLLVAGALGGEVEVDSLRKDSTQADRKILDALKKAGAKIYINDNSIKVVKGELRAFNFDATNCPDLFPPIVALASHCAGKTVIKGVSRLKFKESDRATVLKQEFGKLGINIDIRGDNMVIEGGSIHRDILDSNNDHRIAMAGAVAAILATDDIIIHGTECTAKSYPEFFDDFTKIGGKVESLISSN